jgi:hypothetical protein
MLPGSTRPRRRPRDPNPRPLDDALVATHARGPRRAAGPLRPRARRLPRCCRRSCYRSSTRCCSSPPLARPTSCLVLRHSRSGDCARAASTGPEEAVARLPPDEHACRADFEGPPLHHYLTAEARLPRPRHSCARPNNRTVYPREVLFSFLKAMITKAGLRGEHRAFDPVNSLQPQAHGESPVHTSPLRQNR